MQITAVQVLLASLTEAGVTFYLFPHVFVKGALAALILSFTCINFTAYLTYTCIFYPLFRSPLRHLPQPPRGSYPLIGHGLIMFKRPQGDGYLRFMQETPPGSDLIYFRSFFGSERLLLTGPAALADVLVHRSYDFEKPPWTRDFLRQFLGDGLLMTEGDEHKHQRKHIMPAFSFRHIKELYPIYWAKSVELCEVTKAQLADKADKILEIGHFSTQVTLDIIGLAGLGRDVRTLRNDKDGDDDELIRNFEEILEPSAEKAIYFVLHLIFPQWLIQALPWKLNKRVKITTSTLRRICKEFVAERKANMKVESEKSRDILSILLRSNNFSDDSIVDQLLTFLAAGHETTSAALTWSTHLLATHPEIQTRLRTEIHTQIPDPNALSDPSFDVSALLESLPYLNAVWNEVLRLYPTIPVTARVAVRNTTTSSHFIPKGTLLFVVPWATNRNPKFWGADAESFNPDRWIDESGRATMNGGADSNFAFLTFLHGPRSCIGEKFARGELRALIAAFVGNFTMEMANPREKIIVGGTITLKPVQGVKLRLKGVGWGSREMQ